MIGSEYFFRAKRILSVSTKLQIQTFFKSNQNFNSSGEYAWVDLDEFGDPPPSFLARFTLSNSWHGVQDLSGECLQCCHETKRAKKKVREKSVSILTELVQTLR